MEEIGALASKEYSLEKALSKMKSEWTELRFIFTQYRDTVRQTQPGKLKNCHFDFIKKYIWQVLYAAAPAFHISYCSVLGYQYCVSGG